MPCMRMPAKYSVIKWTMVGQMAIAIALPGFNDLGCLVTPIFLLMDHFFHWFSMLKKTKKIYQIEVWIFSKMHHQILFFLALCYLCNGFKCLLKGTLCENIGNIWNYLCNRPTSSNMTMMFSSIDLPLMFLTINLCRPCWIMCTNFSKLGYFPTCFIWETTVS